MDPQTLSSRYQPELDQEIRSIIGDSDLPLFHMMRYHMGWVDVDGQTRLTSRGKRLRPSICLLACEAVGGSWKQALPAAASIELLHNFTLIHDDIEDGDSFRRGIPTVWNVWGVPQGINCGDAMHVLSNLAMIKLDNDGIPATTTIHAAKLLHDTALSLCEGQFLDISFENLPNTGINEYLQMIKGKTAALFGCSLKLGAMVGSDDEHICDTMYQFGIDLGMAFQIYDDILGIWGKNSKTGKSSASDILKRKKTLPVIHVLNGDSKDHAEELADIYNRDSIGSLDLVNVLEILEESNARQFCTEKAQYYLDTAIGHLDKCNIPGGYKDDLVSLSKFMINREY